MTLKKAALCLAMIAAAVLTASCGDGQTAPAASTNSTTSPHLAALSVAYRGVSSTFLDGPRANYTVTLSGTTPTVTDNVGTEGTLTLTGVQRLYFTDAAIAYDTSGTAGQIYRLYQSAFNRKPDSSGLGYQIAAIEQSGLTLEQVSQNFLSSPEFQATYGSLDNTAFVTQLYANVLHRAPDSGGLAYHVGHLDTNVFSRAQILEQFSESPENQSNVAADIASGIDFTAYEVTVPATVPGAPTLNSATAGNGSITLAFSVPSSSGGSVITGYTGTCTAGSTSKTGAGTASPITVSSLTNGTAYSCTVKATNAKGTGTASAAMNATPSASITLTGGIFCPYSASVVNSSLGLTSTVSMTCSNGVRNMSANGVPDHATGSFPNANNPNKISAQSVKFGTSLNPAVVGTTAVAHILGFANNGIKFDPSTAESYQNAGVWHIEALGQTYMNLGTDSSNAHVQPDGAYHYHGMPEGYINRLTNTPSSQMTLVGFANDGFPMYARYGYKTASDAKSGLKVMVSSYHLKANPDSGRPSTTAVPMGTFTEDYEYVAGSGDLDECNGRTGVTPEFPQGIYHYFITDTWPYIQRCIKGTSISPPGP